MTCRDPPPAPPRGTDSPRLFKVQAHGLRMRLTPVACVALVALAFAGCSEDPERYPDGVPQTGTTGDSASESGSAIGTTTSSSGTTTTGGTANQPPTGSMAAVVNGTGVTFALRGSDPDADALSWTLAFGDGNSTNGTSLPSNVTHTYAATGNLTATFTLSDGAHSVNYTANFTVGGGSSGVVLSGHVVTPDPFAAADIGCLLDAGRRDGGGPGGVTGQDHPLEPSHWGLAYAFDVSGFLAEFWGDGAILGSGTSGQVPEEALYVVVCISDPAAADSEYQLTLS